MCAGLPPSGSRGFILGEILGRSAGLTCTEFGFARFLFPRPKPLSSNFLPEGGSFGDMT